LTQHAVSSVQLRWETLLGVLSLCAVAPPYVGPAIGLHLNVAQRVEVADHVVPGLAAAGAVVLVILTRRSAQPNEWIALAALGLVFLAGLWMTATHVPLLVQAADGRAAWDASIFHAVWGPPIAVVSLWLLWRELGSD
jgi:hypothetical protein